MRADTSTPISPDQPARRATPPVSLLIALTACGPLALTIFVPLKPFLVDQLGGTYQGIERAQAVYLFALGLGQLIYGPLTDRYGRKPVALVGVGVFCVASIVHIFVETMLGVMLARLFQALGVCVGMVVTRAMVRDVFPPEKGAAALGLITMGMVAVPAFAPFVGSRLAGWFGWQSVFVLCAGYAALVFLLFARFVPETNREPLNELRPGAIALTYLKLLVPGRLIAYSLMLAIVGLSFYLFLVIGPYAVVEVFGRTPQDFADWFILMALGYMLGNFCAGRAAARFGVEASAMLGVLIMVASGVGLLADILLGGLSFHMLFFMITVGAVGSGIAMPNAVAAAIADHGKDAGAASALLGFLSLAIGGVASAIAGQYIESHFVGVAATLIWTPVLALALMIWARSYTRTLGPLP